MTMRTGNVAGDHHDWEKTSARASDAPVHRTIAVTDEAGLDHQQRHPAAERDSRSLSS